MKDIVNYINETLSNKFGANISHIKFSIDCQSYNDKYSEDDILTLVKSSIAKEFDENKVKKVNIKFEQTKEEENFEITINNKPAYYYYGEYAGSGNNLEVDIYDSNIPTLKGKTIDSKQTISRAIHCIAILYK